MADEIFTGDEWRGSWNINANSFQLTAWGLLALSDKDIDRLRNEIQETLKTILVPENLEDLSDALTKLEDTERDVMLIFLERWKDAYDRRFQQDTDSDEQQVDLEKLILSPDDLVEFIQHLDDIAEDEDPLEIVQSYLDE